MATIYQKLDEYIFADYKFQKDERVKHLPLTDFKCVMGILAVYLLTVKVIGPKLMINRRPFKIDKIVQCYNLLQIAFNATFCILSAYHSYWQPDMSILCQSLHITDRVNIRIALLYAFHLNKLSDMLETIFFLLRKKFRQISFLHLYHHAFMITITTIGISTMPTTGHMTSLGIINSFVHAVMYTYYYMSAKSTDKNSHVWWKKYITLVQLAQFVLLLIHNISGFVFYCGYPRFWLILAIIENTHMIRMFSSFYIHNYIKKKSIQKSN